MKILSITAQKPNSTGSGVYMTELVKQFALAGHEQAVVGGIYSDDIVDLPDGVSFHPVFFNTDSLPFCIVGMSDEMPYPSTRYCDMTSEMTCQFKAAFLNVLVPLVNEFQPDLILCHHLYLLTAIVREQFPHHTIYGFCHNTDLRQMKKTNLERDFIASQIPLLDWIFVPQTAQLNGVMDIYHMDSSRITISGMGFNQDLFFNTNSKADDGITRIAFAGKIAEKKGLFSLLRSLSYLLVSKEKLQIYLAGGAGNQEEYEEIRRLAAESPYSITFPGKLSQTELAKLYNACDIFVLPSFFEGIPLTVIEALACGCRVVMTDLPGIPQWLEQFTEHADICYVTLPPMENADEPIKEFLPEFEKRLAIALEKSISTQETITADVSRISWKKIADLVAEHFQNT